MRTAGEPMWIKICANTNVEDALEAARLGASAVGFVFAESKRRVTPEQVAAITARLPPFVSRVGVFTATDAAEILRAARIAGLTVVQLHSAYDPALVDRIVKGSAALLSVVQVVDVSADTDPAALQQTLETILRNEDITAVLLDASHGGASGGTGRTFAWSRFAGAVLAAQIATEGNIIIAGGLTPQNVAKAITTFAPWGVDVASGVEAAPGTKDHDKLHAFLRSARSAG
jgi:phosphoribosylanthranilate isomerase